jgi:glycosyltransferase involved in cell wall biosynthesis
MYHSNLIGGLAGLLTGYKNIIWSIHHNDLSYKLNKRMTIYVAKAGAYLSRIMSVRIVCVSQKVKETHIAFGYNPTSLIVIENGIDTSQFQKLPLAKIEIANELKVDPNITFIGLFGRYDPIKNHAGFLFEIARIKSEEWFKNVHVLLAGPDISHNNQQLTKVITEHGLGSIVHLLGVRNDMPQLMSSLDILVNASFNESFSLVLAEAMSCEIPCITTIEGDPSSIIGGYGYSFPVLKFSDLSVALEYHLTLPEIDRINIGKGARSRIIDLFDLARVVTKYEVLYNSFKASVG